MRIQNCCTFEIPVNIAVNLDDISQMCHFLMVNTTQRSVDKSIEQQIVARLTKMVGLEKCRPYHAGFSGRSKRAKMLALSRLLIF